MDTLQLIGTATGLGFLAGLRLYSTVLTLGLAIRFGFLTLRPEFEQLDLLANWWVIGISGAAFLLEFFADKIPWVDSIWDTVHTVIRPVGASLIGIAALGDVSPLAQLSVGLLTGGAAFTSHSMKAATRLAVNQSPEPVSNLVLSLAGDIMVPFGVWLAMEHPLLIGAVAGIGILLFLLLAPRIFRLLRVEMIALRSLFRPSAFTGIPEGLEAAFPAGDGTSPRGVLRVSAGKGVGGLRGSVGYLVLIEDVAVFVTRRWFRQQSFRICGLAESRLRTGLLMDRLTLSCSKRTCHFGVFRGQKTKDVIEAVRPAAKTEEPTLV